MTGKERKRNLQLTRYIVCALMLGNGLLFAPTVEAEAENLIITGTPSAEEAATRLTINLSGKTAKPHTNHSDDNWTLNYTGTDNAWAQYTVYGSYNGNGGGEFTLQNGTIKNAYGKYQTSNPASNGHVIISGGEVTGAVYGGYGDLSSASNNTVTIEGNPTLSNAVIYGAHAANTASNNTITINSGVTVAGIKGGEGNSNSTGNTLNLGATGIKVGADGIDWTQTIAITSGVGFDTSKTVLEMTSNASTGGIHAYNLDFTNATGLTNTGKTGYATTVGTMTLVKDPYHMISMPNWVYGDNSGYISDNTPFATNTGQEYTPTGGNGAKLIYTNTHTVNFTDDTHEQIDYTIANSVTGVNLADWDSTKAAFAVPTGWTQSSSAISVIGTFTTPSLAAGTSKDIVTAGANFFSNVSIADAIKYKDVDDFTNDTANGVTLSGDIYRGVKVTDDVTDDGTNKNAKLTYFADTKKPTSIVLGDMTWGTGRAMSTGYDFSGVTSINTTNLFSNPTAVTGSMTLLSNATGLTAGDSTSHSQTFSTTADNGATLNATLNGSVTRTANTLGYTATGTTLNSINLNGWTGTAGTLPAGWTKPTTGGVTVATGNFSVTPTSNFDIFTTTTPYFFGEVTGTHAYTPAGEAFSNEDKGVTISGNKAGGVKVTNNGTIANAKLTYYAEAFDGHTITLDSMAWGTPRDAGTAYNFSNLTSIDATNLSFTNPMAVGTSTALLTNATDLAANFSNITYASGESSHTQVFTGAAADNGVKFNGTINGTVSTTLGQVNYTVSDKSITGIDLAGWDSTKAAYSLTGWTKGLTAGSINAAGFTAPTTLTAGNSIDIVTTGTAGYFTDDYITGAQKYGASATPSSDTDAGVTFTGSQEKGVKASATGQNLVYAVGNMTVSDITLGNMAVGNTGVVTPRTADANYTFNGTTTIDATNLTFDKPAEVENSTLVSGATNVSSTNPITGAAHSQAITNATIGNGITGSGTLTGTVSADAGTISYTVGGKSLASMNLSGWNGTTTSLPAGWTGREVAVNTGSFAAPDAETVIFNSGTADFFGTVTGDRAYKDGVKVTEAAKNGVALTGTKNGGVKAIDNGATLKYFTETMNANAITLGKMTWGTGRAITESGYTFDGVGNNGVDATSLTFAFAGNTVNTIASGDDWDLVTGASGLAAGLTVKGSPVSQQVSYGISNVASFTGTLTGKVTTNTNAVHYAVTGKTLNSIDISAWNGTTTDTAVDASWSKNPQGISVTGSGFTTPTVTGEYNILTAGSTGFFTGAQIDSSIAYQPSGAYSETEKNITLSGKQAKGVLANSNGTSLQYKLGEAYIDTIQLGNVAYSKDAVLLDKSTAMYNFSKVTGLDKSGFSMTMTDDQKKTAKAADSMTLVKANGTLHNIAAQEMGKSSYSYTAAAGLTVKGALTGSVAATAGNVLYTVNSNKASDLTVSTVGWNSTYARPDSEIAYSDAIVNAENVTFSGVSTLNKGDTMTLVSNFGTSVNRVKGGIFTLDNGKTGKGHAYWDSATGSLVYVVDRGADETVETKNAIGNKTTVDGENPHQGDVSGGEAEGDGESRGNETTVKNSHIQKNDDGTGGDANGGTSEDGDADKNKLTVEESEVDGDANGGQSDTGNTEENEVIVKKSVIHGGVAGGETLGGHGGSKRNKTTVEESTVEGDVDGGKTGGDGDADENEVIVTGSKIGGDVNGGHSGKGNAGGNKTEVDDSTVEGDVNGGKTDGDGDTKKNEVIVKGSKIGGDVNGGHSGGNGESSGNEADVDGSTVDGDVNGGKSDGNGDSNENKTNVKNGSTVGGSVIGGQSKGGNTNKNETTVNGSSKVTGDVIGGKNSGSGTASENKATVTGSEVGGNVVGGQSVSGNTNQNDVRVTAGSKITGSVIGGQSNGSGTSSANKANVEGSTVGGNIIGGYSKEGTVSTNEAAVNGGSVAGSVYGGKTDGSNAAASNAVTLDGGAEIKGAVYGGYSENGTADGNIVTVNKAAINDDYVYGGKSKLRSSNDLVYFNDGTVLGIIGGGCSEAVSNSVSLLKGGVTEHVIGGFASDTATNNTVNITGGTVNGSVIGGYGGTAAANENTVNLGGGTVKGNTIASTVLGVTIAGGVYGGYSASGTTQNNTVNLYGTADISATDLYGGNQEATGNDLYVGMLLADATQSSWTGGSQSVQNIANFENINFAVVPWSTSKAALTITDGTASDLSKATVSAKNVAFTGVKTLSVNDSMTLLDQSKAAKPATSITEASDFTIGVAVEGTGALSRDGAGNVLYNVKSVRASEQTHNTLMGAEAAMTAINVGNDFINAATEGLSLDENIGSDGVGCFAKIGGGHMQQETGSHINVNTWNAILALGHKNVQKKSTVEYGAFFEYGRGNYATYNDNGQRGDGSVHYTGGGLLGKWTKDNGLYVEGSFRAGTVDEDARNLLRDTARAYSYNTSANYMGFHIGVGKQIAVANGGVVDVYGKYFYNRKSGVNFTAAGADYNLDSVTSQIIRLGARYTMKREKWNYYVDAAYEHELDGKASGRVNNLAIRGADTSGGSFRMELGATLLPQKDSPWNLNLNLTGYAGKKQGIQGGVTVKFMF